MSPHKLARVAAPASLIFGTAGLVAPRALAPAFGITLDPLAAAVVQMASASYIALGVLNWFARDLTDLAAWRAIAMSNLVGWALSAGVVVLAIVSGLGNAASWVIVVLQVAFALAWALAYLRVTRPATQASAPAMR
jgi:hypothetical protein